MITIENKQTSLPKAKEEEGFLTYADLISFACLNPGNNPVSLSEQRIRFKIVDMIESANGTLEFDEKWIPVLNKCINNIATAMDRKAAELVDTIESLNKNDNDNQH